MKKYYTITLERWVDGKRSKIIAETEPMSKMDFVFCAAQLQPRKVKSLFEERTYGYVYNAKTNEKIKELRLR